MQMSEETFENLLDVMEKHFAALKLLDDESEHKLTRTNSFSDLPSTRSRILIEQCFQHPNSPSLMRQYSCEEIVNGADNIRQVQISEKVYMDSKKHTRTWRATVPCVSNKWSTDWNSYKAVTDIPPINKPDENQIEYMEIDKSDISDYNEENKNTTSPFSCKEVTPPESKTEPIQQSSINSKKESYEETKKKCRPLASPTTKMGNRSPTYLCCRLVFFILIPILGFLIAALLTQDEVVKYACDHKSNFSSASIELQQKIYGQDEVILSLIQFLETYKHCVRMGVLVGGTGVGKSYTIDIIRRNFHYDHKLLQYMPPLNKAAINEISSFRCNLIVLENLKLKDLPDVADFSVAVSKFEKNCITVLAVFNVETISSTLNRKIELDTKVAEIRAALSERDINARVFGYKHLDEESLEKCIKTAMKDSNLNLNKDQIEEVKRSLLTSDSGCKGAYAKVQIVGRQ